MTEARLKRCKQCSRLIKPGHFRHIEHWKKEYLGPRGRAASVRADHYHADCWLDVLEQRAKDAAGREA